MRPNEFPRKRPARSPDRRGAVAVFALICMTFVFAFAALAVDLGLLYESQAETQRSADAAALAAARELLHDDRLLGGAAMDGLAGNARSQAGHYASLNAVHNVNPLVDGAGDVAVGNWDWNGAFNSGAASSAWNSARVMVHRDETRNGSIALMFARLFGHDSQGLSAQSTAAFADRIVGFKIPSSGANVDLLPFTLKDVSWDGLNDGSVTTGDNYSYDEDTGAVTPGPDGKLELNLYPGAGATQLPPGNFGTVDIGSSNNSAADIARQILYGVNQSDLDYLGGSIELGADGTVILNGDTGLSAGFKDELEAIKGQPRIIPIFSTVSGNGNNANYTIVAFAGIRIMNVKLTGAMKGKEVIIQPAVAVDPGAVAGSSGGTSYNVYRPVQIVE